MSVEAKLPAADFRSLCCGHFGCAPEDYEQTVFWNCLHEHARLPARLIHKVDSEFFAWDFLLIRTLATATAPEEMQAELNNYRYQYRAMGFLRRNLRIRVSGRKMLNLSNQLFSEDKRAQAGVVNA